VSQRSKQEVNWEFFLSSSKTTLQAYEQSRLSFAANVRKEIAQLLEVWVDENSNALLARYLIERDLFTDPAAISTNAVPGSSGPQGFQTQVACGPQSAPKPSTQIASSAATLTRHASDKIFGEKPFAPPRIHAAS
jgi:hypothetical protein